eukprot:gene5959-6198_t
MEESPAAAVKSKIRSRGPDLGLHAPASSSQAESCSFKLDSPTPASGSKVSIAAAATCTATAGKRAEYLQQMLQAQTPEPCSVGAAGDASGNRQALQLQGQAHQLLAESPDEPDDDPNAVLYSLSAMSPALAAVATKQDATLPSLEQLAALTPQSSKVKHTSPGVESVDRRFSSSAISAAVSPLARQVELSEIPSMRAFIADVADIKEVIKLGEGTYGEAFKAGQVVCKLVPIEGDHLVNGWPQKGAADLMAEAIISQTLSTLSEEADVAGSLHSSHTKAFVTTHRVGVCKGPYPQSFIRAWKAWDKRNKSENDPVDGLPKDQLFACFVMSNCGWDLESYQLRDFDQARSMMLQVAMALAVAEESVAFEHRDLHWGNIMLSPATSTHISCRLTNCAIKIRTEGAVVCLIDFTASRLQTPWGDVAYCDLEQEEGLFDGPKGKCQFETYRRMRTITKGEWSGAYPGTNVQWMLYLCELLLTEKPVSGISSAQKRLLRDFKKRVLGYGHCGEEDTKLQGLVDLYGPHKWSVIAKTHGTKNSKQCRRRWKNYLGLDRKDGVWTAEEDEQLLEAHRHHGNKWTAIAIEIGGRTDNAVKNRFAILEKKRKTLAGDEPVAHKQPRKASKGGSLRITADLHVIFTNGVCGTVVLAGCKVKVEQDDVSGHRQLRVNIPSHPTAAETPFKTEARQQEVQQQVDAAPPPAAAVLPPQAAAADAGPNQNTRGLSINLSIPFPLPTSRAKSWYDALLSCTLSRAQLRSPTDGLDVGELYNFLCGPTPYSTSRLLGGQLPPAPWQAEGLSSPNAGGVAEADPANMPPQDALKGKADAKAEEMRGSDDELLSPPSQADHHDPAADAGMMME